MVPVKLQDDTVKNFCIDCLVDSVKWCHACGEAYEATEENKMGLCNDCRRQIFQGQY